MHHFALGVLFTPAAVFGFHEQDNGHGSLIEDRASGWVPAPPLKSIAPDCISHCGFVAGCRMPARIGGFPCSGDALRGCLGLDLRRQIIHTMTVGLSGGRRLASYDTADTDPARLLGKLTGGCKIVAFALSMPKFDKKGILRRKGNGDRDEQAQTKRDSRDHVYD